MLRIYSEQLRTQLNTGLHQVYILLGNDNLLAQESRSLILQIAKKHGFDEHRIFKIENTTDWKEIFFFSQEISIFSSKQVFTLVLSESISNLKIDEKLSMLMELLHNDLLLILQINKSTKLQENSSWFNKLNKRGVLISCQTPEKSQLPNWVNARARQYNLRLDEQSCQLLCYSYEGNLPALVQAIYKLSLIWPTGKITLPHVKQIINDAAHFTIFHWIESLLAAEGKRALYVLEQLRLEGNEQIVLIRTLQNELLLLINLKRQLKTMKLHELFDKHQVRKNRWSIITKAISRFTHNQLCQAIHILAQAELSIKRDYRQSIWDKLEILSILLCNKALENVFIDD